MLSSLTPAWWRWSWVGDRDWQPEVAVLPYATIQGDLVTVHQIRRHHPRDGRSQGDVGRRSVDSQSGERVFAIVHSQTGNRIAVTAGLTTFGHAKQVMDQWVERLVTRLDEAHGYKKP